MKSGAHRITHLHFPPHRPTYGFPRLRILVPLLTTDVVVSSTFTRGSPYGGSTPSGGRGCSPCARRRRQWLATVLHEPSGVHCAFDDVSAHGYDEPMSEPHRKLTLVDYERIPDDGLRHEIVEGVEFVTPAPDVAHQRFSRDLGAVLHEHVTSHGLGEIFFAPIDVVLSPFDVVQPDIVFVSKARSNIIGAKNIQSAPDLVVEILSPSTAAADRGLKSDLYARAGVEECWLVDLVDRSIEIRGFRGAYGTRCYREGETLVSECLPGFAVAPRGLFLGD